MTCVGSNPAPNVYLEKKGTYLWTVEAQYSLDISIFCYTKPMVYFQ